MMTDTYSQLETILRNNKIELFINLLYLKSYPEIILFTKENGIMEFFFEEEPDIEKIKKLICDSMKDKEYPNGILKGDDILIKGTEFLNFYADKNTFLDIIDKKVPEIEIFDMDLYSLRENISDIRILCNAKISNKNDWFFSINFLEVFNDFLKTGDRKNLMLSMATEFIKYDNYGKGLIELGKTEEFINLFPDKDMRLALLLAK